MTSSEIKNLVDEVMVNKDLPKQATGSSLSEISKSLGRYFNKASADKIEEFTGNVQALLKDALNIDTSIEGVTIGGSKATIRSKLLTFLEDHTGENIGDTMNLDFFLRIPMEVAEGAAKKLAQNWDQDRVDAFPALELKRVYPREVPRGSELDPQGPENGWDDEDGRWMAACEEAGDDDAMAVFEETGRMVALKSSDIWQALGDGAGDYNDTLGTDFPPFAFNSGMDVDEVSYEDCVKLGLLDEGAEVEGADLDLEDLFPEIESRYYLQAGDWNEDDHPRDKGGKFAPKGAGEIAESKFPDIHGRSVVQVIRRLAHEGFTRNEIRRIMNSHGLPVSSTTIAIQYAAGQKGENIGSPFTEEQMKDLRDRAKSDAPRPPKDEQPKPEQPEPPKQEQKEQQPPKEIPPPVDPGASGKEVTKEEAADHLWKRTRFFNATTEDVESFKKTVSDGMSPFTPQALGRVTENVNKLVYASGGEEFQKFNTGTPNAYAFYRPSEGMVVTQSATESWVIAHECAHGIDRYHKGLLLSSESGRPNITHYRYSQSPEFIKAWKDDKKIGRPLGRTTDYWKTNEKEGFAVSCEHAHLYGYKNLKERAPHMAKLLADWKILRTDT